MMSSDDDDDDVFLVLEKKRPMSRSNDLESNAKTQIDSRSSSSSDSTRERERDFGGCLSIPSGSGLKGRKASRGAHNNPNVLKAESSIVVQGDDALVDDQEDLEAWRKIMHAAESWVDSEFPPRQASINGENSVKAAPAAAPPSGGGGGGGGGNSGQSSKSSCRCGAPVGTSAVKSDTPNKGRPYHHCAKRLCGHFAWADGQQRAQARKKKPLQWQRFSGIPVVTDYGFTAADLRQGGVGDCWFLSALAVVAERHDLVARLFGESSMRQNDAGCYQLRLFLDGKWKCLMVDDHLPVTDAPRRPELAFESRLAFSRCGGGRGGGGQQLWVSLLEKAYAKAHGSYDAISGGQIAEALLDLTGAPCEAIDLSSNRLNLELVWQRLVEFRRCKLPMGCATDGDHKALREVGLCGGHAYSILDVREAVVMASPPPRNNKMVHRNLGGVASFDLTGGDDDEVDDDAAACSRIGGGGRGGSGGCGGFGGDRFGGASAQGGGGGFGSGERVRLLRIRNPHGVGEWNGDWSDASAKWSKLLFTDGMSQQQQQQQPRHQGGGGGGSGGRADALDRPTGVDDGTFWMDYTHFLQGFSRVDVCFAHPGWHAKSVQSSFPLAADKQQQMWRVCGTAFMVNVLHENDDDDDGDNNNNNNGGRGNGGGSGGCRGGSGSSSSRENDPLVVMHVTALQPTQRGAKLGRSDRKKSYRPGDVSLVVVKCDAASGEVLSVVTSALDGADDRTTVTAIIEDSNVDDDFRPSSSGSTSSSSSSSSSYSSSSSSSSNTSNQPPPRKRFTYLVLPLCLGSAPTAAETTKAQPFTLRFFSSSPLKVCPWTSPPTTANQTNPNNSCQMTKQEEEQEQQHARSRASLFVDPQRALLSAWHLTLLGPTPCSPTDHDHLPSAFSPAFSSHGSSDSSYGSSMYGGSKFGGSSSSRSSSLSSGCAEKSCLRPFALPQPHSLRRWVVRGSHGCDIVVAQGSGVLVLVAVHRGKRGQGQHPFARSRSGGGGNVDAIVVDEDLEDDDDDGVCVLSSGGSTSSSASSSSISSSSIRGATTSSSRNSQIGNEKCVSGSSDFAGLPVVVRVTVTAKSNLARCALGKVANNEALADAYYKSLPPPPENNGNGGGGGGGWRPKWPAKWKAYHTSQVVQPNTQQVLLLLVKSGMQAELGAIECEVRPVGDSSCFDGGNGGSCIAGDAVAPSSSLSSQQPTMKSFFASVGDTKKLSSSASSSSSSSTLSLSSSSTLSLSSSSESGLYRDGLFSPAPLDEPLLNALEASLRPAHQDLSGGGLGGGGGGRMEEEAEAIAAALAESQKQRDEDDEDSLLAAVIASTSSNDATAILHYPQSESFVGFGGAGGDKSGGDLGGRDEDGALALESCEGEGARAPSWTCSTCTFLNEKKLALACEVCGGLRSE